MCCAALLGLPDHAFAKDAPTRGLRYPSITKDGKQVVFSYRGDIWVAATDGKSGARRLTIHESQDTVPCVSPDGKQIAFTSRRNGAYDVFVLPIDGGEPRQVTFHGGVEIVTSWSPDGKKLLFASNRDATQRGLNLFEIPVRGGTPRQLTIGGGRDGSYSADGKWIVYAQGTNTIYQDNYRGSGNYDLYVVSSKGGLPRRLTRTDGNERYPHLSADGKTVWFVAEEKGVANFYSLPIEGVDPEQAEKKRTQVTRYKGADVHRPSLSADRKTAVFERSGALYHADLTSTAAKAVSIPLVVKGDRRHSGIATRTIHRGAQHLHVSGDGARLAASVHGDIWILASAGGNAKRVTSGPTNDEWPRFSPDGTKIAYQSDRHGNSDLFVLDLKTKKTRQITKHKSDDFYHNWSPDGSRLVFSSERSGNRDIWTIDVESGELKQITKHPEGDDDPVYSPDGRWIAFDSGREGGLANHHIFVIAADGSGSARRVTSGAGFFQVPSFSPDGQLIAYESASLGTGRASGVYVVATSGGRRMAIAPSGAGACWSPRGDYIYFSVGDEGAQEIYRVPAPKGIEGREKVPFTGLIEVDLRRELADLFDEAWKRLKDGFYDPKMHGVNWNDMKKKYRDMAIDAEDKAEFQNVVSQMLAELNASHLGIYGGRKRTNTVDAKVVPTGYLGLTFEDRLGPHGGRVIKDIMTNGPAAKARLRVGDEVTRVNRKRLKPETDLDAVLNGTVGKEILVSYRPITGEGVGDETRTSITPASQGAISALVYKNWTSGNARKVRAKSKGRLAYIHLNQMNAKNLQRFQRAVATLNRPGARRIKGMVLDVRGNGGGNIHQQLMQIFTARPFAQMKPRRAPGKITQPALYWDKPVVLLMDERSFSDAEVFPYTFKTLKVGKVVGMPTPGGVIGTNDVTLSDGSRLRIPRVGYYGMDGTNLEGHGVKPDYRVELTPEDRVKGRDPQLDKAIEVVLAEISGKKPSTKPQPKPTTKPPVTKPTTPPDTKPTDAPSKAGDTAPASRTAGPMDPLADAKVGEWVRYRLSLPQQSEPTVVKISLTGVEPKSIAAHQEIESGTPFPVPLPETLPNLPLLEGLTSMGEILEHKKGSAEVGGKQVETAAITVGMMGGRVQLHFTNAIPGWGLYRVQIGKVVLMQATEWGTADVAAVSDSPAKARPDAAPVSDKPASDKPASDKPVTDKPASDKPAKDKPVSDKPVRVPGPKDGAARGGDGENAIDNPLRDAKVGEWVRWKQVIQGQPAEATLRVVEVSEDKVVLESSIRYGKTELKGSRLERPRRAKLAMRGGKVEVAQEKLTVNGKELDCTVVTRTRRNGRVDKRWYCGDIPVTGLVRHERAGTVVRELVAWGPTS